MLLLNPQKKLRRSITLSRKIEIIEYFKTNARQKSRTQIANELKISRGTLRSIVENEEEITMSFEKKIFSVHKFHLGNSNFPLVDRALLLWIQNVQENPHYGAIITGDV
jgi:hypothetical protein